MNRGYDKDIVAFCTAQFEDTLYYCVIFYFANKESQMLQLEL